MLVVVLFISIFILSSCASTSDIGEIKSILLKDREETTRLQNRIDLLEIDVEKDKERLHQLEKKGGFLSNEANNLRIKIKEKVTFIYSLEAKLDNLKSRIDINSENIGKLGSGQKKMGEAAREASKKNHKIKRDTNNEIIKIEERFDKEREGKWRKDQ